MERRSFIKGLLISATAGEALVKLATPEETSALAVAQPILLKQEGGSSRPFPPFDALMSEVYIKNGNAFQSIGFVREVSVHHDHLENFSWDGTIEIVPGFRHATARFSNERNYDDQS
jgi:hypothetical protein